MQPSAASWPLAFVSWLPSARGRYLITSSAQREDTAPAPGPPSGRTGGAEGQASGRHPQVRGGNRDSATHPVLPTPAVKSAGSIAWGSDRPAAGTPLVGCAPWAGHPSSLSPSLFAALCNGLAENPHSRGPGWAAQRRRHSSPSPESWLTWVFRPRLLWQMAMTGDFEQQTPFSPSPGGQSPRSRCCRPCSLQTREGRVLSASPAPLAAPRCLA